MVCVFLVFIFDRFFLDVFDFVFVENVMSVFDVMFIVMFCKLLLIFG